MQGKLEKTMTQKRLLGRFLWSWKEAMQDAASEAPAPKPGFCFERFRRWYHQAGTPVLRIQRHWDGATGRLDLTIQQHTPATPGQPLGPHEPRIPDP